MSEHSNCPSCGAALCDQCSAPLMNESERELGRCPSCEGLSVGRTDKLDAARDFVRRVLSDAFKQRHTEAEIEAVAELVAMALPNAPAAAHRTE